MTQVTSASALDFLQRRPLTPAATLAVYAAVIFVIWSDRRRSRKDLKSLDDHLLNDIGVTPSEAYKEAERPFWQG
ncbi:MAG: DUF1127 domain-containing protein [Pseudomonadota bacterium]